MTGNAPAFGVEQYLQTSVATEGLSEKKHLQLSDEFPMVCETCLGPNPYIRMIKIRFGDKLCKMSNTAFQSFRWKAGPGGRFKETIICKEVALEKNVCQACLTDMTFGVPVGVRDALLKAEESRGPAEAVSETNRAYLQSQKKREIAKQGFASSAQIVEPTRELLGLARSIEAANSANNGTAFRNLSKLCSFWVKGSCTRVKTKTCPFRPCCGAFKFPEIAATHPTECAELVTALREKGPAAVMNDDSFQTTKDLLKTSGTGVNRDESIKNRITGKNDIITQRYLARQQQETSESSEQQEGQQYPLPPLRPELAAAMAKRPRQGDYYPSMDPNRLGGIHHNKKPAPPPGPHTQKNQTTSPPPPPGPHTQNQTTIPPPPPGPPPSDTHHEE